MDSRRFLNMTVDDTALWEAVAAVSVLQLGAKKGYDVSVVTSKYDHLFLMAGIRISPEPESGCTQFGFGDAMRAVEGSTRSYHDILGQLALGIVAEVEAPQFPNLFVPVSGPIVIAPFGLKSDLNLTINVWASVAQMLRTYGLMHNTKVMLAGVAGERMDGASFMEDELMGILPLSKQLQTLASASLVVGVPNAWTWLATSFRPIMVTLYPDDIPPRRWFPFADARFGRALFDRRREAVPVVLSAVRRLIQDILETRK